MKLIARLVLFFGLFTAMHILGGGRVFAGGTVTNCTNDTQFSSMLAGGGTVTFNCGTATIVLTSAKSISANTTIDGGGNITLSGDTTYRHFVVNGGATLTLQNITLSSGYANGDGGSIYNNGTLNVTNTTFYDNHTESAYSGGAIVSYGTLNITNSTFASNTGGNGGAVYPRWSATITIKGSSFHENETTNASSGWGGAILTWDGPTVTIEDSTFASNKALYGGAIFNTTNSTVDILRSTFFSNRTTGAQGAGGAIYTNSTVTVASSSFLGNGAFNGGALANYSGTINATNVTLHGNYSGAYGNALYNNKGNTTLTNATIFSDGNGTSYGQIVHYGLNNAQRVRLKNTLIDASDSTPNPQSSCYNESGTTSTIISDGNNLFTDGGCGNLQLSDKINTPSLLGPPDNNGGATVTLVPQANSQALNNGTSSGAPTDDQRGITRPQGAAVDIGAVERCPKPSKPTLVAPANGALVGKKPKLDWSDASCFAKYTLQVRQGSKKGSIILNANELQVSQYKMPKLKSGELYYWRVSVTVEGESVNSAWRMFSVE